MDNIATWISLGYVRVKKSLSFFDRRPSLILKKSTEQCKQQRANLLSKLHNEPPPIRLQAYFERLKGGSPKWDTRAFVEGAKQFARLANLSGSERAEYYGHPLLGLHYANSFTAIWNRTYPQQPISVWDQDIRCQGPPGWSNELRGGVLVLSYSGEAPLSQGLSRLLQGPTTLDCGMFCQLILWMAIRYLLGDSLFDEVFPFQKGQFVLTQTWNEPMNKLRSRGNMLYPFYDNPLFGWTTDSLPQEPRIQTRAVFNHGRYLAKHPGGEACLYNGTLVDGEYIIFDPGASKTILSPTELDQRLNQMYNASRDSADSEKLWLYDLAPDFVHHDFAPRSFGKLAEEARYYEHHTLSETDWKASQAERESKAHGLHLAFNFQKLISYVKDAQEARLNGDIAEDILSRATPRSASASTAVERRQHDPEMYPVYH